MHTIISMIYMDLSVTQYLSDATVNIISCGNITITGGPLDVLTKISQKILKKHPFTPKAF